MSNNNSSTVKVDPNRKWRWWQRVTERGAEDYRNWKELRERAIKLAMAEQVYKMKYGEHVVVGDQHLRIRAEPDKHEYYLEKTEIVDPDTPKPSKPDKTSYFLIACSVIGVVGALLLLGLNLWGFMNYIATFPVLTASALLPLWVDLLIIAVIAVSEVALTTMYLYLRWRRGKELTGLRQILFQVRDLTSAQYYRDAFKNLEDPQPVPTFSLLDVKYTYYKTLGKHMMEGRKQWSQMTQDERNRVPSVTRNIDRMFNWILDPHEPVTCWIMPFKGWGYYKDSKEFPIENIIEFWLKGPSLEATYSMWAPVDEPTGYGYATQKQAMFTLRDMGWGTRRVRAEDTGEVLEMYHPIFAITAEMPFGQREYLSGDPASFADATEKVIKTCEGLPSADSQRQEITSLKMTIARLEAGNRESRDVESTVGLGERQPSPHEVGSEQFFKATASPTGVPSSQQNLQANGGGVGVEAVKKSRLTFGNVVLSLIAVSLVGLILELFTIGLKSGLL